LKALFSSTLPLSPKSWNVDYDQMVQDRCGSKKFLFIKWGFLWWLQKWYFSLLALLALNSPNTTKLVQEFKMRTLWFRLHNNASATNYIRLRVQPQRIRWWGSARLDCRNIM